VATPDDVRRFALELPESTEQQHHGHPDFRVRKKIFATLWPDEGRAVVKLAIADQQALVQMQPDRFSLGGWAQQGWTNVNLAQIDASSLRDIIVNAWRHVAPKTLVRQYDDAR